MHQPQFTFAAQLWIWDARKSDSWTFATVSPECSDDLREQNATHGFGSIPVDVTIGDTTWQTSIFPDKESGCFVLPIKAAVRKAESIAAGDTVEVALSARV